MSAASGSVAAKIGPRPTLKNLTRARVPRNALFATTLAVGAALAWKFVVADPHKRKIQDFYKTFDPERDYARMKASGVFKSLDSRTRPEWLADYEKELDQAIATLRSTSAKK